MSHALFERLQILQRSPHRLTQLIHVYTKISGKYFFSISQRFLPLHIIQYFHPESILYVAVRSQIIARKSLHYNRNLTLSNTPPRKNRKAFFFVDKSFILTPFGTLEYVSFVSTTAAVSSYSYILSRSWRFIFGLSTASISSVSMYALRMSMLKDPIKDNASPTATLLPW